MNTILQGKPIYINCTKKNKLGLIKISKVPLKRSQAGGAYSEWKVSKKSFWDCYSSIFHEANALSGTLKALKLWCKTYAASTKKTVLQSSTASEQSLPRFVKNSDEYLPIRAMDRGIGPRSSIMCARWSSSRE